MPSRHAADIRQVAQKTGRSLDEWCELLEANGVGERREAVNMLRDSYAVSHAFAVAAPGDVVLLAPACSSFDMFRDYADRGRAFKQQVHRLQEERSHG